MLIPARVPLWRLMFVLIMVVGLSPWGSAQSGPVVESTLSDGLAVDEDADGAADRGDTLEYDLRVRNTGDQDAESVTITLPPGMHLNLLPESIMIGPIALDDSLRIATEASMPVAVLANDRDVDGMLDPASLTIVEAPILGSAVADTETGEVVYTAPAAPGADTFRYTIADDDGMVSRSALVSVVVNACPVAQDDALATMGNEVLSANILSDNGNGIDADSDAGDTLSVTAVNGAAVYVGMEISLASGARLTLNADGSLSYDPNGAFDELAAGENDTDSFTYTVSDGLCEADATVVVTVSGENMCPTAADDAVVVDEDSSVAGNILSDNGNGPDSDPDTSNTLLVSAVNGSSGAVGNPVSLASGAQLTLNADGSFSYDPNGAFEDLPGGGEEMDTFTYTVSDGTCSDDATVTVTINGENDCPVAASDSLATDEDTTLNGNVLADNGGGADSDVDMDAMLSVTAVNGTGASVGSMITLASGAQLTLNADGTFSYVPNGAFDGLAMGADDTDSFTYTVSDGTCSDDGNVTVTIGGVNDCPVAAADAVATDEDNAVNGNVLTDNGAGADSDADTGATLTVTAVNGSGANVGNLLSLGSGATVTLNADGTFTYDPNGSFEGLAAGSDDTDSFTYTVGDGTCTDNATVTITINGVNDCPAAEADSVSTDEDSVLNGNVLTDNGVGADSDADTGTTLTVTVVNGAGASVGNLVALGSGATVTLNTDGSFSYDPNGAFEMLALGSDDTDSFTYTVSDGTCTDDATVTVNINGVNDCPVAAADGVSTNEDSAVMGNVLADNGSGADSDADTGATLTVTAVNGSGANVGNLVNLGSGAQVTLNSDGSFTYDPNGGFEALGAGDDTTDTFTYTVSDGTCADDGTVTMTINGVNDAPMAAGLSSSTFGNIELVGNSGMLTASATGSPAVSVTGNLLTGATDVDTPSGSLSVNAATGSSANSGSFQVFADGSFTYRPPVGFTSANDTFTYTITDGAASSSAATVTIAVSDQVWFINNTAGGSGGTGTSSDPFLTTADFNTANGSGANAPAMGDRIFVFQGGGNYTTGITLLDNQTLEGQGVALVVDSNTLLTAGTPPTITSTTTDGISLASGNTIRGLNVANTPGFFKVSGAVAGNLAVSDVALTGTGGAIEITTSASFGSNVTFSTLESTSSPGPAIDLTGVSGTLAVTAGGSGLSGNNAGSDLIRIAGGTVSMSYPGVVNKTNGGALVSVSGGHNTGTIQFPTAALSATAGTGLQFDNADGVYTFAATVTLNGGDAGIDIINGSDGNFTFTNAPITDPTGVALNINGGGGTITHGGALSKSTAGRLVEIQSRTGGSVTVSGTLTSTGSSTGIRAQNNVGGTMTFSGSSKVINIGTGTAVTLTNNTGSTTNFTNGGLAITTTAGGGMSASTAGTVTVSGGVNSVTSTGGAALDIDTTTLTMTFASLSATNSTAHGVDISNVPTSSSLTVTGATTIANPTNRGLNIDDVESSASLTFGDITVTNRGSDGIAIRDFDGTALTFGDVNITNGLSAGGNGVLVDKAGATSSGPITFASLDISNTVVTIDRVDAGADGIPDNETHDGHGVKLVDHTGGFTITGAGTQGNGGTIEQIQGDGISMIRSSGLDIDDVTINNIGTRNTVPATVDNAGVYALNVTGSHHIKNSTISRFQDGGAPGSNSRGVYVTNNGTNFTEFRVTDTTFFNDASLLGDDAILVTTFGNVTGAVVVESLFSLGHGSNRSDFFSLSGHGVQVLQNTGSGTLTTTISNSRFRDAEATAGFGGIEIASTASGTMSSTVSNCSFFDLYPQGVNNGGIVTFFAGGTVNFDGTVDSCTFGSGSTDASLGRGAVRATTDSFTDAPTDFDITVTNCFIDRTDREAITIFAQGNAVPIGSGQAIDINISDNNIGQLATTVVSGREGIEIRALDAAKRVNLTMVNNNVTNFANSTSDETVDIDAEDNVTVVATLLGNFFDLAAGSTSNPNSVEVTTEDVGATLCLDMNSSNINPNTATDGILLTETAGAFSIEDLGGSAPKAFLEARNTATVTVSGTLSSCNEH